MKRVAIISLAVMLAVPLVGRAIKTNKKVDFLGEVFPIFSLLAPDIDIFRPQIRIPSQKLHIRM